MSDIALAYANTDNASQALSFIHRARGIDKGNVNYVYAEAEVYAILGHTDDALKSLRQALEEHYPAQFAAGDEDLHSLNGKPEFAALIKEYSAK